MKEKNKTNEGERRMMKDKAIKITAKFDSTCRCCGADVKTGDSVTWIKGYGVECEKCNPDGINMLEEMIDVDTGNILTAEQRKDVLYEGSEYNFDVTFGAYRHFLSRDAVKNEADEWSYEDYQEWDLGRQSIYVKNVDGKFRMSTPSGKTINEEF